MPSVNCAGEKRLFSQEKSNQDMIEQSWGQTPGPLRRALTRQASKSVGQARDESQAAGHDTLRWRASQRAGKAAGPGSYG